MRVGDLYFDHPRTAFALQTVTAFALGYITHLIQLNWYHENYLLLHISIWWLLIVLVLCYLDGMPLTHKSVSVPPPGEEWEHQFRTIAVIEGSAPWWDDMDREDINPDFPALCPLFHNVCARMPTRWNLGYVSHDNDLHTVNFTDRDDGQYTVFFGGFEDGLNFQLATVRNATFEGVQNLLCDLDRVLRETDGIESVRWFPESIFDSGCLISNYQTLGASSPTDPVPETG